MKTTKLIFLIFACFGLLFGCNNFEMPDDDLADVELKNASAPAVFLIEPGGGDDTPAFMQAFEDAKAAGPGSVVQLVEGEYHLGLIEIRDFFGMLKGAGRSKTVITATTNNDIDPVWAQNLYPDLVKFVGGDVHICHLTIQTPPGAVSTGGPGWGQVTCLMSFTPCNTQYELNNDDRSINAVIDHVSFKGQYFEGGVGWNYNTFNCAHALRAGTDIRSAPTNSVPRAKVNLVITNTDFDTFICGLYLENLKNSKLIIGMKNNGNVFNNLELCGGIYESRNMEVMAEGNTFNVPELCWGLDVDDYPWYKYLKNEIPEKPSIVNFRDNVFNLNNSKYALYFRNRRTNTNPGDIPVAFQVRNNQFNMTSGNEWGIVSYFTDGMVIRNNKFSGHGDLAFNLRNFSKNGLVLGNNFSTVLFETGVAFLTSNTQNWTFVGGNFTDRIIDLGVNNVFTGMNVSTTDLPLGRSISEVIVPMNHFMK